MTGETRTLIEGLSYLECPRWRDGRIWFSDFYTYAVYSAQADGTDLKKEVDVPQQPSGLGWLPDGRMLVISMRDVRLMRLENDGSLSVHAELTGYVTDHQNDMVVDGRGRAYLGEYGFDLMGDAPLKHARLLHVDPVGSVNIEDYDMLFPNGMAITNDGTLLVSETFGNRVSAFTIAADGSLTDRRVWAEFEATPTERELENLLGQVVVAPDGCCLDAGGALWVADAVGGRVIRVLEGGTIDQAIDPGTGVFACMIGGQNHRTLFMCAAPDFQEEARKQEREGRLLAADVEVARDGLL